MKFVLQFLELIDQTIENICVTILKINLFIVVFFTIELHAILMRIQIFKNIL